MGKGALRLPFFVLSGMRNGEGLGKQNCGSWMRRIMTASG